MANFPSPGTIGQFFDKDGVIFENIGPNQWDEVQVGYADQLTPGLARIATQADTDGGTDDQEFVTPKTLADMGGTTLDTIRTNVDYGSFHSFAYQNNSMAAPSNSIGNNGDICFSGNNAGDEFKTWIKRSGTWRDAS